MSTNAKVKKQSQPPGFPRPPQAHPIYGGATAEQVALKLQRRVTKPVRTAKKPA